MDNKVIKIGLLGLGTVGTGVYKLIGRRSDEMEQKIGANLEIEKILVHNLKKTRHGIEQSLLTDRGRILSEMKKFGSSLKQWEELNRPER